MGSSIGFYCGPSDIDSLQTFAQSIGLHIVASSFTDASTLSPETGPFCYLSIVDMSQLHPYGNPLRISGATDPVMRFMRAYFKDPYLVLGHVYWSNDVPGLAAQTKPYYQKLARWIRKEWEKAGDFYFGPEAKRLADKGAELVNVLPGTANIRVIEQ